MTRTIRRLAVLPTLALAAAFGTACDDGVSDVERGLVGQFDATEAVFTDAADPNTSFDLIAEGGTMDVDFRSDGTFTSNLRIPGRDEVVRTGTFTTEGPQVAFTSGGVTTRADFQRDGNLLTLSGPSVTGDFDFGDDRGAIPARFDARFAAR